MIDQFMNLVRLKHVLFLENGRLATAALHFTSGLLSIVGTGERPRRDKFVHVLVDRLFLEFLVHVGREREGYRQK